MVDQMTPPQPGQPAEQTIVMPEKRGFLATGAGKAIAIVLAVLFVLGIAGAVAVFAFGFWVSNKAEDVLSDAIDQASQVSTVAAGSEVTTDGPALEPAAIAPEDIFTFRDIFDPLVKPVVEVPASTDASSTTDTEADVLYLEDIVSEDGAAVAVLLLNGTEYRLKAGGTIPNTPWQVLSIGDTSVVMLFGDSQVTLSIGQGTSK